MQVLEAVLAVEAVEKSQKRIDRSQYPESTTFFSEKDHWLFNAVSDTNVCPDCLSHEDVNEFTGDLLRAFFPYLEIVDSDTIYANVHPNCRCTLTRIINLPVTEE